MTGDVLVSFPFCHITVAVWSSLVSKVEFLIFLIQKNLGIRITLFDRGGWTGLPLLFVLLCFGCFEVKHQVFYLLKVNNLLRVWIQIISEEDRDIVMISMKTIDRGAFNNFNNYLTNMTK